MSRRATPVLLMCVPRVLLCISEVGGQQGVTGEAEAAHG